MVGWQHPARLAIAFYFTVYSPDRCGALLVPYWDLCIPPRVPGPVYLFATSGLEKREAGANWALEKRECVLMWPWLRVPLGGYSRMILA